MLSVKNNIRYFSCALAVLLLSGCASMDYASKQGNDVSLEKAENLEQEPITRLSFVPVEDAAYDNIEIVTYQDGSDLSDIMPAAGDAQNAEDTASSAQ